MFAGTFTPVDPTEYPLLYTGALAAVQLAMIRAAADLAGVLPP